MLKIGALTISMVRQVAASRTLPSRRKTLTRNVGCLSGEHRTYVTRPSVRRLSLNASRRGRFSTRSVGMWGWWPAECHRLGTERVCLRRLAFPAFGNYPVISIGWGTRIRT